MNSVSLTEDEVVDLPVWKSLCCLGFMSRFFSVILDTVETIDIGPKHSATCNCLCVED